MAGYRQPYTTAEDKTILKYIIDKKGYNDVKGRKFWQDMEESGRFDRTWQSLKEHFRKYIIHNLHLYGLTPKEIQELQTGNEADVPRKVLRQVGNPRQSAKTANSRKPVGFHNIVDTSDDDTE